MSMNARLWEYSVEVTSAILGVDGLYRRALRHREGTVAEVPLKGASPSVGGKDDSLASEGLVAINLSQVKPVAYEDWSEADRHWGDLRSAAGALVDKVRCAYYEDLATSILEFIAWQQSGGHHLEGKAFARLGSRLLGLERLPFAESEWEAVRTELRVRLHEAGYDGPLAKALRSWETERHVPREDVVATLNRLLADARERVEERLFRIPTRRTIHPVAVHGVPYSAYCDYEGCRMYVNLDQPYTLPALRHLVAHEAYPGHLTHIAVREAAVASREAGEDALLVVTDTPTSPIFEGIGDNGLSFCWDIDNDDKLASAISRVRAMATCHAALRLAASQPAHLARVHLQDESAADPSWVEQRLSFLSYRLRRPFIFAYAWGERIVGRAYHNVPAQRRRSFFDLLYREQHSPRSLKLLEEVLSRDAL